MRKMSGRLADKVAIITGAATGIGKVAALLFAVEGAAVIVADIHQAFGEQVAEQIKASGGQALFVKADVTAPKRVNV